jgi:hypothetical protein
MAISLLSTGLQFPSGLIQTTKRFHHPTSIGSSYGGGYYVGSLFTFGYPYYLIAAAKSTESSFTYGSNSIDTSARIVVSIDGYLNTYALVNDIGESHPAASYCWNLSSNDYTDWYLPSIYELVLLANANHLLPETERIGTTHLWSSNYGNSSAYAFSMRPSGSASTISGYSHIPQATIDTKGTSLTVRAFRRISI